MLNQSSNVKKVVSDLLAAKLISKTKYTTWLSNVLLIKKYNNKWRLNKVYPKDAYIFPILIP